jgi:uncharacterized protein with LGFP repeats
MPTTDNGFEVFGAIEAKWLTLRGVLGHPVTNETPTFDTVGRFQNFEKGMISWHPDIARMTGGAHVVWGLIGARWLLIGREVFGYPTTDETDTASVAPDKRGKFNHFRSLVGEASIFFSPGTGAHEIYGDIRDFWAQFGDGWERSPAGYPIGPEQDRAGHPGQREQEFQNGLIIWTSDTRATVFDPTP